MTSGIVNVHNYLFSTRTIKILYNYDGNLKLHAKDIKRMNGIPKLKTTKQLANMEDRQKSVTMIT